MVGVFFTRWRFSRIMAMIQIIIGLFVIFISIASLHRFYNASGLLHLSSKEACHKFDTITEGILREGGYAPFDLKALSEQIDEVLSQIAELQDKLESTAMKLGKNAKKEKNKKVSTVGENITLVEFKRFLEEEVIRPLYDAHISLRLTRIPRPEDAVLGAHTGALMEDPLLNYFTVEETRKYITAKANRDDMLNVYDRNKTYNTIGHTCVLMKKELDKYMNYDVGSYCGDDWELGQQLMIGGCDPLPRRRCLARASKLYQRPLPINESLWTIPDDGNVRWSKYKCRNFKCLSYKNPKRGYNKCVGCFDMEKEKLKWVSTNGSLADFLIKDVLKVKPGEIRIGLDVSVTTGTFAARMREFNVTIVSTALNLGAPFSDTIALRGLIPLYTTMSQRLPFFDNTMDLIHTSKFLDGWIDLQLMDFILFDWDRVLRPGGLLWVDKFSCARKDLDDYMYMFLQFRYKKHKWVVSFKSKKEVYLSALLEKPPRSL